MKINKNGMEKIRISYKRDLKIFLFAFSVVSTISIIFFKVNIEIIFILGFTFPLMLLLIIASNYIEFSSIYFSNKGLFFKTPLHERKINWEELSVAIESKRKDQTKIIFKSSDFKRKITIDYVIIESLVDLTKKYCPKEHDLYVITEEFSKNKKASREFL